MTSSFDYLCHESILFDDKHLKEEYKSIEEIRLRRELETYRKYGLSDYSTTYENSERTSSSSIKIFTSEHLVSPDLLKQTALYMEQAIIPDPLFPETYEGNQIQQDYNRSLGLEPTGINRQRVAEAIRYIKDICPMLEVNYVQMLPMSHLEEPPENISIGYSPTLYIETVPDALREYFFNHMTIKSLKNIGTDLVCWDELIPNHPAIYIEFDGHNDSGFPTYHYQEQVPIQFDEERKTMLYQMKMPEVMEPQQFAIWLTQSMNQSAGRFYSDLMKELFLSSKIGASYLTSSEFTSGLLSQVIPFNDNSNIERHTAQSIMNLELPFLDDVSSEIIMKVRQDDGEVFAKFRLELDKYYRELRLETDEAKRKLKEQNLVHELCEVQVSQVESKLKSLKKDSLIQAGILGLGFAGAVVTKGWSMIAAAHAVGKGYKNWNDYQEKVKENPSYFLWRVMNQGKKM